MAGGALSALLLCITINVSKACFSSGICGGGFGCAPPIAPVCVGGCSPGYACGQFGCYSRARARSSKTFGSAITKNKRLQEAAPDTKAMYLHYDGCPVQALADISYCAAGGYDHTQCCIRNGVTTTLAGPKCLTFCDQRPGNVTRLDMSYLPCYDRFDNIKSCFMERVNHENEPQMAVQLARTFES